MSTVEQDADLQTRALKEAGCLEVYTDHGVSGTKARRPQLDKLLEHARAGDEVVVWKLDRLGRNTRQRLELIDQLESQNIHFRSLTEGITTTGPMGTAMLTVMSASPNSSATSLRSAPRPAWPPPRPASAQYRHAGLTPPEIGKLLGVSRATVYRYLALVAEESNG